MKRTTPRYVKIKPHKTEEKLQRSQRNWRHYITRENKSLYYLLFRNYKTQKTIGKNIIKVMKAKYQVKAVNQEFYVHQYYPSRS